MVVPRQALAFATSAVKSTTARFVHTEKQIEKLGYKLPVLAKPQANYVMATKTGNLLFTAGHLPQPAGKDILTGKVGVDYNVEEGYEAARYAALSIVSTLKSELGDLDRVKKIVKVVGFVNCPDGFKDQPKVINGASDTFGEIFGERGVHARSAVGTNALPLNVPVEVEVIVEFE